MTTIPTDNVAGLLSNSTPSVILLGLSVACILGVVLFLKALPGSDFSSRQKRGWNPSICWFCAADTDLNSIKLLPDKSCPKCGQYSSFSSSGDYQSDVAAKLMMVHNVPCEYDDDMNVEPTSSLRFLPHDYRSFDPQSSHTKSTYLQNPSQNRRLTRSSLKSLNIEAISPESHVLSSLRSSPLLFESSISKNPQTPSAPNYGAERGAQERLSSVKNLPSQEPASCFRAYLCAQEKHSHQNSQNIISPRKLTPNSSPRENSTSPNFLQNLNLSKTNHFAHLQCPTNSHQRPYLCPKCQHKQEKKIDALKEYSLERCGDFQNWKDKLEQELALCVLCDKRVKDFILTQDFDIRTNFLNQNLQHSRLSPPPKVLAPLMQRRALVFVQILAFGLLCGYVAEVIFKFPRTSWELIFGWSPHTGTHDYSMSLLFWIGSALGSINFILSVTILKIRLMTHLSFVLAALQLGTIAISFIFGEGLYVFSWVCVSTVCASLLGALLFVSVRAAPSGHQSLGIRTTFPVASTRELNQEPQVIADPHPPELEAVNSLLAQFHF